MKQRSFLNSVSPMTCLSWPVPTIAVTSQNVIDGKVHASFEVAFLVHPLCEEIVSKQEMVRENLPRSSISVLWYLFILIFVLPSFYILCVYVHTHKVTCPCLCVLVKTRGQPQALLSILIDFFELGSHWLGVCLLRYPGWSENPTNSSLPTGITSMPHHA